MNLGQIVTAVQRVLKDPAILRTEIIAEINRQVEHQAGNLYLPDLLASSIVEVAVNTLAKVMPTNFHHSLVYAYSVTHNKHLKIRTNTKALYDGYDMGFLSDADLSNYMLPLLLASASDTFIGPSEECCEEHSRLFLKPAISEAEDIHIRYYRKPTAMVDDDDAPEGIPSDGTLHQRLIVSGTIMAKLPETDMEIDRIKQLMALHNGWKTEAENELRHRFKFAPKHTPKFNRKIKEF